MDRVPLNQMFFCREVSKDFFLTSCSQILLALLIETGTMTSARINKQIEETTPITKTGRNKKYTLTPPLFNAISSLFLFIRPKVINTVNRIQIGVSCEITRGSCNRK